MTNRRPRVSLVQRRRPELPVWGFCPCLRRWRTQAALTWERTGVGLSRSPDGKWLSYTDIGSHNSTILCVIPVDGGEPKQVGQICRGGYASKSGMDLQPVLEKPHLEDAIIISSYGRR